MKSLLVIVCLFPLLAVANDTRYTLVVKGDLLEDDRLIDSKTGKIWKRSCVAMIRKAGKCTAYIWKPEAVEGLSSSSEIANYVKYEAEVVKEINEND